MWNPTSIKTSGQDEENEVGLDGRVQEEKVQVEEPWILKGGGEEDKELQMIQDKKQEQMKTTLTTYA